MASAIKTWQIVDGRLQEITSSLKDAGKTEAYDLESWIASNPTLIGTDLVFIGRQVQTLSGPLDLLAIDRDGNLVIVELKRDRLPREALVQALDYASDVASWSIDKIKETCTKYIGKDLEDVLADSFPEKDVETISINAAQRIILAGFAVESSLERMMTWLSSNYGISVNAIVLHYARTSSGDETLSRTAVISEEVVEKRIQAKKFQIPMSDEPGTYEEEELRQLLVTYLKQDLISVRRIRNVLLPLCQKNGVVQREELKRELVRQGEADPSKAGYSLTTISGQLGMEKNDFLRQVIKYDYPNNSWEKDNYKIRTEYKGLVQDVLTALAHETGSSMGLTQELR